MTAETNTTLEKTRYLMKTRDAFIRTDKPSIDVNVIDWVGNYQATTDAYINTYNKDDGESRCAPAVYAENAALCATLVNANLPEVAKDCIGADKYWAQETHVCYNKIGEYNNDSFWIAHPSAHYPSSTYISALAEFGVGECVSLVENQQAFINCLKNNYGVQ